MRHQHSWIIYKELCAHSVKTSVLGIMCRVVYEICKNVRLLTFGARLAAFYKLLNMFLKWSNGTLLPQYTVHFKRYMAHSTHTVHGRHLPITGVHCNEKITTVHGTHLSRHCSRTAVIKVYRAWQNGNINIRDVDTGKANRMGDEMNRWNSKTTARLNELMH